MFKLTVGLLAALWAAYTTMLVVNLMIMTWVGETTKMCGDDGYNIIINNFIVGGVWAGGAWLLSSIAVMLVFKNKNQGCRVVWMLVYITFLSCLFYAIMYILVFSSLGTDIESDLRKYHKNKEALAAGGELTVNCEEGVLAPSPDITFYNIRGGDWRLSGSSSSGTLKQEGYACPYLSFEELQGEAANCVAQGVWVALGPGVYTIHQSITLRKAHYSDIVEQLDNALSHSSIPSSVDRELQFFIAVDTTREEVVESVNRMEDRIWEQRSHVIVAWVIISLIVAGICLFAITCCSSGSSSQPNESAEAPAQVVMPVTCANTSEVVVGVPVYNNDAGQQELVSLTSCSA